MGLEFTSLVIFIFEEIFDLLAIFVTASSDVWLLCNEILTKNIVEIFCTIFPAHLSLSENSNARVNRIEVDLAKNEKQ